MRLTEEKAKRGAEIIVESIRLFKKIWEAPSDLAAHDSDGEVAEFLLKIDNFDKTE